MLLRCGCGVIGVWGVRGVVWLCGVRVEGGCGCCVGGWLRREG